MTQVHVRVVVDGAPMFVRSTVDEFRSRADTWWRTEIRAYNPVTRYRFYLLRAEVRRSG